VLTDDAKRILIFNQKNYDMKTSKNLLTVIKSLLIVTSTALFSFSAGKGGDSFEIYLNGKLLVQQFVYKDNSVKSLQVNYASADDRLDVYYSHCGQTGKSRYITIKDAKDRALKVWQFPDTGERKSAMTIMLKDIPGLQKNTVSSINLFYSSKELPSGRLLASISTGNASTVARK
jgi:hypothetical protein